MKVPLLAGGLAVQAAARFQQAGPLREGVQRASFRAD